jgi:hypothetical protein
MEAKGQRQGVMTPSRCAPLDLPFFPWALRQPAPSASLILACGSQTSSTSSRFTDQKISPSGEEAMRKAGLPE